MIHTTVFTCITLTKDMIDCDGPVHYARLVIQKVAVQVMIGFDAEVFAVCVNATERFAVLGEGFEFH